MTIVSNMVKASRKKEKKIRVEKEDVERGRIGRSEEAKKHNFGIFYERKRKGVYISINFRSKDSDLSVKTNFEQILKII